MRAGEYDGVDDPLKTVYSNLFVRQYLLAALRGQIVIELILELIIRISSQRLGLATGCYLQIAMVIVTCIEFTHLTFKSCMLGIAKSYRKAAFQ